MSKTTFDSGVFDWNAVYSLQEKGVRWVTTVRRGVCIQCGEHSDTVLINGRNLIGYCENCRKRAKLDRQNESNKRNTRAIKQEVIDHYGGKCMYCDETNIDCLQIDHINGNGSVQRSEIGAIGTGFQMYYWLKRNNYPTEYQVLCARHNYAKSNMNDAEFRQFIIDTYLYMDR